MIPSTVEEYLGLITTEHSDRPKYIASLAASLVQVKDTADALKQMLDGFDVDSAVGVQLDQIGIWVGISRQLDVPLEGVYFTWDDTALTGWDSGIWKGEFDPTNGLTSLPDNEYRTVLKARIAANYWDGTIPGAQAVWNQIFDGKQTIVIQDNQDMSMAIGFVGPPLTAVQQALLTGGYFPLKPEGVRISFYAIPVDENPLFSWDAQSSALGGWDTGTWAQEL